MGKMESEEAALVGDGEAVDLRRVEGDGARRAVVAPHAQRAVVAAGDERGGTTR